MPARRRRQDEREPIEPPAVSDKPFAEMPLEGTLLNVIEVGVHAEFVPV